MGSTLPSPLVPKPVPSVQPIIFNNLFPTLLSSRPGLRGGGGGLGGFGGPGALRRLLPETPPPEPDGGTGASG